jgi:hypothetical protein
VPETRKGLFNSHLNDVSKFFKSFHVQINARNEGDVDPDAIMKRVSESSGANYSFHKEARRAEPAIVPVVGRTSFLRFSKIPLFTHHAIVGLCIQENRNSRYCCYAASDNEERTSTCPSRKW